jgi:transcriptional regulator with XRE-family HTH domain
MTNTVMRFDGRKLAKRRLELGLKQRAVADMVGMNPSNLSHVEGGRRQPSQVQEVRLAQVLRCSRESFYSQSAVRDPTDLGRQLRDCRFEMDLTLEEAAELLGVSGRTVRRWQSGKSLLSHFEFEAACLILRGLQIADEPLEPHELRSLRRNLGCTVLQLARLVEHPYVIVNAWENGRETIPARLGRLLRVLGHPRGWHLLDLHRS